MEVVTFDNFSPLPSFPDVAADAPAPFPHASALSSSTSLRAEGTPQPSALESSSALDSAPSVLAPAGGRCPTGYALFILLNAIQFVRPGELFQALEGSYYQGIIIVCLIASWPVVLPQLKWSSLKRNPITLCVVGLLPAVILSHLRHGDTWYARMGAIEFTKIVVYYLLLVGLIDSPQRLRSFLRVITAFVLVTACLSLLNHFGVIHIPALDDLLEGGYDPDLPLEAQPGVIVRLRAMGIFNDPNDFCLILNAAAFICLHFLLGNRNWSVKFLWALPISLCLWGVALTQSRGGFLGLSMGLLVLVFTRLPRKKAIWISLLLLPVMLVLFAGRSTNIDVNNDNDTAQGRIHLWREAMIVFHRNPLFGVGEDMLPDEIGLVAHDSYVQAYAELGLLGGTFFAGAFYLAVSGFRRLRADRACGAGFQACPGNSAGSEACTTMLGPELASLRLCLLPVLAEYMMGIYSLSRNYVNTTYLVLGLVAAFLALADGAGFAVPIMNRRLARNVLLASVGCVLFFEVFCRTMAR